ncbi:MAG: hypothetical protein WDZ35_06270 [Crocinitomicaceae bacterium]
MNMRFLYTGTIFTFLLAACATDHSEELTDKEPLSEMDLDTVVSIDDEIEEDAQEEKIITAYMIASGPDNEFFLEVVEDENGEKISHQEFTELHMIPSKNWGGEDEVNELGLGIMVGDFGLWDDFSKGEFDVVVYYNRSKTKKLANYHVIDGNADGFVRLYTPEGDLFMSREYENGEWIASYEAPYGADWEFDQSNSALTVTDKKNAFTTKDGLTVVSIMPSLHYKKSKENSIERVVEKASFKRAFTINGDVFTGRLVGYREPFDLDPYLAFELDFKDGWLDGDVKLYNYWGDLELHERFVAGELDTTVFVMDPDAMDGMAKPIIYIYPEKETLVDVRLDFDGTLTTTYPDYQEGWKVLAKPDGTLIDEKGKEYYALYWEGENRKSFTVNEGFVIAGKDSRFFLEKSLEVLNLNRREANEFIVFWLPLMESNPYNLIHFSTKEYEEMAKLKITPKPESLIRIMMVFKPLNERIEIPQQDLTKLRIERKGFTVVEWGGHQLSAKDQVLF